MKKFFLIPLLTLMCSVMAWGAVVNVAQVGDVVYQSNTALSANNPPIYKSDAAAFTAAITAANSADGQTVVLLKTIEKAGSESSDEKTISANMTIDGQGQYSIPRSFTVNEGKTLTLKDVTVNDGFKSNPAGAIVLNNGATLVMNNATIAPTISGVLPVRTVQGASATIQLALGSTNVIRNNGGTALYTYNQAAGDNSSVLTITGDGALNVYHTGTGGYALSANANGGNFLVSAPNVTFIPSDPTKFIGPNAKLADGYLALYEDGTYKVLPTSDSRIAAAVNGMAYASLAAAVEAASTYDEITLYADAQTTTISKSLTINANGHNASAISAGAGYARVAIDGGYVFGKAASKSGNVYTVSTFDELWFTVNYAAVNGDEIKLANDIAYPANATSIINITKSITLDGQGHKIVGWGTCNSNHGGDAYYIITPLAINYGEEASNLDVTLKNISMSTVSNTDKKHEVGLTVMDKVAKLSLKDCDIRSHTVSGAANSYGIAFYGETADALVLDVENSFVSAGASGYAFTVLKPIDANLLNSTLEGYSSVTFYAPNAYMYAAYKTAKAFGMNNSGSRGTTFYAKSCDFNAPNVHSGVSNAYATFAIQDDGINLTLDNCGIDATQLGDQQQWGVMLSPWTPIARRVQNVNIEFTGDNSHINGTLLYVRWLEAQWDKTALAPEFNSETWAYWGENGISLAGVDHSATRAFSYTGNINVTISGGTYAQNVGELKFPLHVNTSHPSYTGTDFVDADLSATQPEKFIMKDVTIPEGYEVKEIETQQGGLKTKLYRVRKTITTSNSINDNVEGQGAGQNEHTEFLIGSDETVAASSTVANYVEVSNNATLTVPSGKELEVTNGLDVTGGATLVVEAGSTIVVGEGGVTSENTESIVIEANENGSASFLLDPEVIINTTPNLTVKMTVKGKGYKNESAGKTYYWHRFAAPVVMAEAWSKAPNWGTWLYGWNYTAEGGKGAWAELASSKDMVPFQGYTLSPEHLIESDDDEIVYSFKGQLAGNQNMNLQFNARGFNFFGNSYTGYISVLTLVDQLMGNENIDGTVYMWNNGQGYEAVSLKDLEEHPERYDNWQKEIAPMQTFILRQINTGEAVSTQLNYENSIWNNPRYGNVPAPAPAPKRAAADADPFVRVMITAANGQNSQMSFAENADRSDDFEKGYDALKYMNENSINLYSSLEGQNLANVATNDLEGKTLTLQTNDEIAYTMSFPIVEGEKYAIRDNATGAVVAIEQGATYEFAAQPNSTVEGRFEIVNRYEVVTALENTEVKANAKGIYSITGQYLGEDFNALPSGVYVVSGVKIVK